ncbi:hypothetical protein HaLaN_27004, partial [Haematococcus lacustris]
AAAATASLIWILADHQAPFHGTVKQNFSPPAICLEEFHGTASHEGQGILRDYMSTRARRMVQPQGVPQIIKFYITLTVVTRVWKAAATQRTKVDAGHPAGGAD